MTLFFYSLGVGTGISLAEDWPGSPNDHLVAAVLAVAALVVLVIDLRKRYR